MKLTIKDYAKLAKIGLSTAYRHVAQSKVPSTEIDGVSYVILGEEEMRQFENTHEKTQEQEAVQRLSDENTWLRTQVESLQNELSQVRKRSDSLIAQLSTQLDHAHLQLEDTRGRKWWQVWK